MNWAVTRENLALGFSIRSYENKPAQLKRLARLVQFHFE